MTLAQGVERLDTERLVLRRVSLADLPDGNSPVPTAAALIRLQAVTDAADVFGDYGKDRRYDTAACVH